MDPARTLREARVAARLTQRELARRARVPQSTVARIETGKLMPRVDTFDRLLDAADHRLTADQRPGFGVDRVQIREMLRLAPGQRFEYAVTSANNLMRLLASARRTSR